MVAATLLLTGCAEPVKADKPFLTRYRAPLHIAHRGGGDELPEHTLYAYDFSITHTGTDVLEVDVRRTCDGQLVIAHDDDLMRTLQLPARIKDVSLDFLRTLEVPFPTTAGVPAQAIMPVADRKLLRMATLDEVISRYRNCLLNIEVKLNQDVDAVVGFLRAREQAEAMLGPSRFQIDRNVCFASFDDLTSRQLRQAFPGACHTFPAQAAICTVLPRALPNPVRNESTNCRDYDLLALSNSPTLLHDELIQAVHGLGLPVHVWTVNDKSRMRELLTLGVDGIMTDRPQVLREVMQERGLPARGERPESNGPCFIQPVPLAEARTDQAHQRCGAD